MEHLKKMRQEELIIHTCDGDDDLTEEQAAQAFCLEIPMEEDKEAD